MRYTYQRIIANISVVSEFYIDLDDPRDMLVDGIIRPMITGFGVYCFLHRNLDPKLEFHRSASHHPHC